MMPKAIVLVVVNAVILCLSIVIIGCGIKHLSTSGGVGPFLNKTLYNISVIGICVGLALLAISLFGIYGAANRNNFFLSIYVYMMNVMIFLQIILCIVAFIMIKVVNEDMEKKLAEKFSSYSKFKKDIDYLQETFYCCSVYGAKLWKIESLPPSCCGLKEGLCIIEKAFKVSCYDRIKQKVNSEFLSITCVCLGIIFCEIGCIMMATCLKRKR